MHISSSFGCQWQRLDGGAHGGLVRLAQGNVLVRGVADEEANKGDRRGERQDGSVQDGKAHGVDRVGVALRQRELRRLQARVQVGLRARKAGEDVEVEDAHGVKDRDDVGQEGIEDLDVERRLDESPARVPAA